MYPSSRTICLTEAIVHQTTLGLQAQSYVESGELVPDPLMIEFIRVRSLQRQRFDDRPEILQRRIALFRDRTIPILEYYGYRHRLLTINGTQPPEQVQQEIWQKLGF